MVINYLLSAGLRQMSFEKYSWSVNDFAGSGLALKS